MVPKIVKLNSSNVLLCNAKNCDNSSYLKELKGVLLIVLDFQIHSVH